MTSVEGIRSPIVLPPMAFASGGLLASQVNQAGGFGFFSPSTVLPLLDDLFLLILTRT